jgi:hypothetical protein
MMRLSAKALVNQHLLGHDAAQAFDLKRQRQEVSIVKSSRRRKKGGMASPVNNSMLQVC